MNFRQRQPTALCEVFAVPPHPIRRTGAGVFLSFLILGNNVYSTTASRTDFKSLHPLIVIGEANCPIRFSDCYCVHTSPMYRKLKNFTGTLESRHILLLLRSAH